MSGRWFGPIGICLLAGAALWPAPAAAVPPPRLEFRHLSIAQGLSQSIVDDILQDREGFLWFVTEDGLNRFDGYTFKVFKHDAQDPFSLVHNEVKCVFEDSEGVLWIGSFHRGLDRFDPATGRFTHHQHDPADSASLSGDIVWDVCEDRAGRLWVATGAGLDLFDRATGACSRWLRADVRVLHVDRMGALWAGTAGGGLHRLDPDSGVFTCFRHDPADPRSLGGDDVRCLAEDGDGALWVGTRDGGLSRLAPDSGVCKRFRPDPRDPGSLSHDSVLALTVDTTGQLWVGTDGGGLNLLDRATESFAQLRHEPNTATSLAGDRIRSLLQDRAGVLWVGTYGNGLSRCNLQRKAFQHLSHNPGDPHSLGHDIVWSFCEDQDGAVWIGTHDAGLDRWDRATGRFTHFRHDPRDPATPGHNSIRMVARGHDGRLWLATDGGGLDRFDPASGRFTHFRHDPAEPGSLAHDVLRMVFIDRAGAVWAGTFGGGLDRFDPETGGFVHHRYDPADPKSISNDYVRVACEDRAGALWLGTHGGGLNRFDRATGVFTRYRHDPQDPQSLSNDFVFCIHEDRTGALWVATYGGGLNRFDPATGIFTAYRRQDGLPDDAIYGILEAEKGRLWLSTNGGLARFSPATGEVKTYTIADGLQSNEFNGGAYYRSRSGEMFFGGINGFNVFHPLEIKDSEFFAPVVLTDFQLMNRSVSVGPLPDGRTLIDRPINMLERLVLSHRDNVVSFEFAALDFTAPEKNRYAYRLEGLSDEWVDLGTRRYVMFTTLPAGRYTLRVKGTNSDGAWNETGAALALVVRPPWWRTRWAEAGYALLLVGAVLGIVRFEKARERSKGRLLEAELRAQAAELQSRAVAAESRALKQENERKGQELEEARRLQLSMLPAHLPDHPRYGITARMRPATEVGGDYYDYHVASDGSLTLAIGDATGHGTRAGIMVAIMKGMFARMCAEPDLTHFMQECNRTLGGIKLERMYMALGLLRLEGQAGRAVAAAMPPIFIHRRRTSRVEQITVRGVMLGAGLDLPYEEVCFAVEPGDTLLLVSDGFLEQLSPDDEMLDCERCASYLAESIGRAPAAMIDHLMARFDAWRQTVSQVDDVTIVLLEVKG